MGFNSGFKGLKGV